jgi:hypothetical protein
MVAQTQKKYKIMTNLFEQSKEITSLEYMDLESPIFKGQSKVYYIKFIINLNIKR